MLESKLFVQILSAMTPLAMHESQEDWRQEEKEGGEEVSGIVLLEGDLHTAGHRLRRPSHHLSNSTSPSTLLCSNPPTAWPGMALNITFSSLFGDHIWLSSCRIWADCRLRCEFKWGLFCASTSFAATAPAF